MHMLLLLAGVISVVAGGAAFAYVYLYPTIAFLEAAITSATIAMVGGFLLIGLGSVLSRLRRIADTLEAQPFPQPLPAAIESRAREPLQPPTPERRMDEILPPLQPPKMAARPPVDKPHDAADVPPPPRSADPIRVTPAPSPSIDAGEALHVDGPEPVAPPVLSPVAPPPPVAPEREPAEDRNAAAVRQALEAGLALAPVEEPPPERRVLKSGVIEGMAYTLFSDGSVEAELAHGTMRFGSISEWRAHMRDGA